MRVCFLRAATASSLLSLLSSERSISLTVVRWYHVPTDPPPWGSLSLIISFLGIDPILRLLRCLSSSSLRRVRSVSAGIHVDTRSPSYPPPPPVPPTTYCHSFLSRVYDDDCITITAYSLFIRGLPTSVELGDYLLMGGCFSPRKCKPG